MSKKVREAADAVNASAAQPEAPAAPEQAAEGTQEEGTQEEGTQEESSDGENSDEEDSDEEDEAKANAEHPEAAYIRELLVRNGLKTAWLLSSGICFDEKHARHMSGTDFEALPTISAE